MKHRVARNVPPLLLAALLLSPLVPVGGDPVEADEGWAYRSATWSLDTPANYTTSFATIQGGNASLAVQANSRTWTSDAEFNAYANATDNVTVQTTRLRLAGDPSNRVVDSGFDPAAAWTFSPSANVAANASEVSPGDYEGRFNGTAGMAPQVFDEMDTTTDWLAQGSSPSLSENDTDFEEPPKSVTVEWSPGGNPNLYGGAQRQAATFWDFSNYTGLRLWTNTSVANLWVRLRIEDTTFTSWVSANQSVGPAWEAHDFNFSAAAIDLSRVFSVEVQFTGVTGMNQRANVDDLRLYIVTALFETATINQTVTKTRLTQPRPGEAYLSFDLNVTAVANVTANLDVTLNGPSDAFTATFPITVTVSNATLLDPSLNITAAGDYDVAFALRVDANTTETAAIDVRIDTVQFVAPGYFNGSYLSDVLDLSRVEVFDTIAANVTLDTGTDTTIFARGGNSSDPADGSWTSWITHPTGTTATTLPPSRYVQFLFWLNTTAGLRTPFFDDFTYTSWNYYALPAIVTTEPYTPAETVYRWHNLTWNATLSPGTAVGFEYSTDGGNWSGAVGGLIDAAGTPSLWIRAILSATNTSLTPILHDFTLHFEVYGALDSIVLTPGGPLDLTAGDPVQFNATVYDTYGHPLPTAILWNTTDPSGNLTSGGLYTAELAGTWLVCASDDTLTVTDCTAVNVTAGPPTTLVVTPGSWNGTLGDSVDFNATFYDAYGNPVDYNVDWNTTDPANLIDPNGLYTAGTNGTWLVCAWNGSYSDCATVQVGAGALDHIVIAPSSWNGTADDTVDFNATGYDAFENEVPLNATWSTTDPGATVDGNGTYAPHTAGPWNVTATDADTGINATAAVDVTAGELFWILILPASATVAVGDSENFGAYGTDRDGNSVPLNATWSTDNPGGSIDDEGLFIPCAAGDWTVRAEQGVVWEEVPVTVLPGTPATLEVLPPFLNLTADETGVFTADLRDACDNPTTGFLSWTTTDPAGSVADGLYEPGEAGQHTVRACYGLLCDTATVNVTAGNATRLEVLPDPITLTADATYEFAAVAYDAEDNSHLVSPAWSTTDPGGTIDPSGLYAAHTAGDWKVRATLGNLTAEADVTVLPGQPAALAIAPSNGTFSPGDVVPFLLLVRDADGNVVVPTLTEWSWDAGARVESITRSQVTLQLPPRGGPFTVRATHGALNATATVTIAGPAISIVGLTDLNLTEDQGTYAWNLSANFAGEIHENLSWRGTLADASLAGVEPSNWGEMTLRITPRPDAHGSTDLTVTLAGKDHQEASETVRLTVSPVNDPPRFARPPDLRVKAGADYTFDYAPYIKDVDGPGLTLRTSDEHAAVDGLKVTYRFPEEFLGRLIPIGLNVTDGEAWARQAVVVNVTDNAPPQVLGTLPAATFAEDSTLLDAYSGTNLAMLFADEEELTITLTGQRVSAVLWDTVGPPRILHANLTADLDWFGREYVFLRATDPKGAFAEIAGLVTVTPVNDAPVLTLPAMVHVRFDAPAEFDLTAFVSDVDDSLEDLALTTNDPRATVLGTTLHLLYPRFTLGPDPQYLVPLTITASDGEAEDSDILLVNVTNNAPPQLVVPIPDVRVFEDTVINLGNLGQYFLDAEDVRDLTFAAAADPLTATLVVTTLRTNLTLTPPPDWFGSVLATVTATDSQGASVTASFRVIFEPVNDEPVLLPLGEIAVAAGSAKALDLSDFLSDVDTPLEDLTLITNSPHIDVYGLVLVLRYPVGSPASESVTVTVLDGTHQVSETMKVRILSGVVSAPVPAWVLLALAAVIALGLALTLLARRGYTFEDAFLISKGGKLISHKTRRKRADRDEDVYAAMVTAIYSFAQDSFREEGESLKRFETEGNKFLVEKGEHCFVAAIYGGEEPAWAADSLKALLEDVEARYGEGLAAWSGDIEDLPGIGLVVEAFVTARRYRSGGWAKYVPKGSLEEPKPSARPAETAEGKTGEGPEKGEESDDAESEAQEPKQSKDSGEGAKTSAPKDAKQDAPEDDEDEV